MRFKSLLSFSLLFLACISFGQKKGVTIKLTYKELYCGGARPSEEMLKEAQKARPYSNKKIIIVSDLGKVNSVKTNAKGELKIKLKPGSYKLYENWRYSKKTVNGKPVKDFDQECLKQEWQKEVLVIKVGDNISVELINEIIQNCPWTIPCILDSERPPVPN